MMRPYKMLLKVSSRLFLIFLIVISSQPIHAQSKDTDSSTPFKVVPEAHEVDSVPLSNGYPPILIGPGDFLTINVYGETQLATEYQVDADGRIPFPFLGSVKVSNLTPNEASEKLANALSKPRKVSVFIKESNTYWVSVIGEVLKPGKYQIKGKPTLLSTLSDGGVPANDADLTKALIIH